MDSSDHSKSTCPLPIQRLVMLPVATHKFCGCSWEMWRSAVVLMITISSSISAAWNRISIVIEYLTKPVCIHGFVADVGTDKWLLWKRERVRQTAPENLSWGFFNPSNATNNEFLSDVPTIVWTQSSARADNRSWLSFQTNSQQLRCIAITSQVNIWICRSEAFFSSSFYVHMYARNWNFFSRQYLRLCFLIIRFVSGCVCISVWIYEHDEPIIYARNMTTLFHF